MDKFTKIILERIGKGDVGLSGALAPEQIKYKRQYGIDAVNDTFRIIDKHGRGKKYSPLKGIELIPYFKNLPSFKPYTNGNYIIVLDLNSQEPGKKESIWHVSVIDPIKAFPRLDQFGWNQFLSKNNLGKVIRSYVIDTDQYDKLKVYKTKYATVTVGGPSGGETVLDFKKRVSAEEYNKWEYNQSSPGVNSAYKDEIKKIQKDEKDVVVNTTNAKFQQVLNNFYIKFNLTGESEYTNFVRTSKRPDGSWDGDIGTRTTDAINYVKDGLEPEYTGNNINNFTKRLQSEIDAVVNESVNYFKGDNIQVSLSGLFEQALKEGFNKEKADAARKTKKAEKPVKKVAAKKTFPKKKAAPKKKTETENPVFGNKPPFKEVPDNFAGQGTYHLKHDFIKYRYTYVGEFKNGDYNGQGIKTYGDGRIETGVFKNGKYIGKSKDTSNKIVRQKNGFLISKSSLDTFREDYKKYSTDTTGKELGAKKLMYGKSFKIRNGIGAYKDNQWRGYQQVNTNYVDSKGNIDPGVFDRNFSPYTWNNVKKGTLLNVKITAVKFIVGPYYGKPEPNIYTYVYCTTPNTDKGFWVPTTWITLN